MCTCLSINPSIYIQLSICLNIYVDLSTHLSTHTNKQASDKQSTRQTANRHSQPTKSKQSITHNQTRPQAIASPGPRASGKHPARPVTSVRPWAPSRGGRRPSPRGTESRSQKAAEAEGDWRCERFLESWVRLILFYLLLSFYGRFLTYITFFIYQR